MGLAGWDPGSRVKKAPDPGSATLVPCIHLDSVADPDMIGSGTLV
jgi:hypothetical protein